MRNLFDLEKKHKQKEEISLASDLPLLFATREADVIGNSQRLLISSSDLASSHIITVVENSDEFANNDGDIRGHIVVKDGIDLLPEKLRNAVDYCHLSCAVVGMHCLIGGDSELSNLAFLIFEDNVSVSLRECYLMSRSESFWVEISTSRYEYQLYIPTGAEFFGSGPIAIGDIDSFEFSMKATHWFSNIEVDFVDETGINFLADVLVRCA